MGDGTDALMLSAETAIGHDPALTVATMARIAARAEQFHELHADTYERGLTQRRAPSTKAVTVAMAHAALRAADELDLAAIVCCTRAGPTARAMAALRPSCRLIGASPSAVTARQLTLSWGVEPLRGRRVRHDRRDGVVRGRGGRRRRAGAATATRSRCWRARPTPPRGTTDVLRVVSVE